jgi:hypothetical protein
MIIKLIVKSVNSLAFTLQGCNKILPQVPLYNDLAQSVGKEIERNETYIETKITGHESDFYAVCLSSTRAQVNLNISNNLWARSLDLLYWAKTQHGNSQETFEIKEYLS